MAIKPLAELEDFELLDSDQDCRGWTVVDAAGRRVGTVSDMLADTEGHAPATPPTGQVVVPVIDTVRGTAVDAEKLGDTPTKAPPGR